MTRVAVVAAALLLSLPVLAQSIDQTARREHLFPLVVDGDGFRSQFFLGNPSASANSCTLLLQGQESQGALLDSGRLRANDALTAIGADAAVDFADGETSVVLATAGDQALAFGYARLECRQAVNTRLLLTLGSPSEDDGDRAAPIAMSSWGGARAGTGFLFHLPRQLGGFAVALSNSTADATSCEIDIGSPQGDASGTGPVTIAPGATHIQPLGQTSRFPDGAYAIASCDSDVAALGLSIGDALFSALPPVALGEDAGASKSPMLPLIVDGGGFRSELLFVNPAAATNQCELVFSGLNHSRFHLPQRVGTIDSGVVFTLDGRGDRVAIASTGESPLALGFARLECAEPVAASNLLSLEAGGELIGMTAIPGTRPAAELRLPVFPGFGRIAMAFSNDELAEASCSAELIGNDGQILERGAFYVDLQSTLGRFLAELLPIAEDFSGGAVSISCDRPLGAVSLPLSGVAFTALPAAIAVADTMITGTAPEFDPAEFPPILIFPLDEAIDPLQLPEASGGEAPLSYSLAPEVPGLRFDPVARQLSGTPSQAGEFLAFYQARDVDGDSASHPLFILVPGPDAAPSFAGVDAPEDRMYTLGVEIEPLQLPEAAGGDEPLTYFLQTEVPGLGFDELTRSLSGTPTRTGVYEVAYAVADVDFDMDSLEFTITVTVPASSRPSLEADGCSDGAFVDDPAANPELTADCRALVGFANSLIAGGLIMGDNAIRQWGEGAQQKLSAWSGVFITDGRVSGIDLPVAELKGDLPEELGQLDALLSLDLSSNELTGGIPPRFAELSKLKTLRLSNNRLRGPIPPDLSRLGELENLFLYKNEFSGTIPPELSRLTRLENLRLGGNRFEGGIPAQLAELSRLRDLSLWGNALSGEIPAELARLSQLRVLRLSRNGLEGSIPRELAQLEKLEELSLGGNQLSGAIPPELAQLENLSELDLGLNQFTGGIPPGFGPTQETGVSQPEFQLADGLGPSGACRGVRSVPARCFLQSIAGNDRLGFPRAGSTKTICCSKPPAPSLPATARRHRGSHRRREARMMLRIIRSPTTKARW